MDKQIFTSYNSDELKNLIAEALIEANKKTPAKSNPEDMEEDYMNQMEAARFLKISFPTIIRWKKDNKIPYYQEGKTVLFRKSELLKVLQKNESLLR